MWHPALGSASVYPLLFRSIGNIGDYLSGLESHKPFCRKLLPHDCRLVQLAETQLFSAPSLAPCHGRVGKAFHKPLPQPGLRIAGPP